MAMPEMEEIKNLALKYSSKQLGNLVAMGQLDIRKATLAGQMRKRIAQQELEPPKTTVAQDTLQPQPQPQMAGLGAAAGQPMPPRPPQGGVNQVPVPPQMFKAAQGGIVGYRAGGSSVSLVAALDRVLSQMKASDPALNTDYVRRSVLSAPPEQQQQLVSDLMNRVSLDNTPTITPSFSQALSQKTVDPRVMSSMQRAQGLTPDEMAVPSPLTKQASGLAAVAQRDPRQADTGAQFGARPLTGSQVLAQKANAAGNIYARPAPPMTTDVSGMPGTFAPYEDAIADLGQGVPEPIDPFSATQGSTSIRGGQTDPGEVPADTTPSAAIIKKDKELEELAKQREKIEEAPVTEGKKGEPKEEIVKEAEYDALAKLEEYEARLGLDKDFTKDTLAEIEEAAAKIKNRQSKDLNMAGLKAGLAMMAGTSPYAFENIAKGALVGLEDYGKSEAQRRKDEKELLSLRRDLRKAQQERAEGRLKNALTLEQNYWSRKLNVERNEISRMQADAAMIQARKGPAELEAYNVWAAQQKAAGKPSDMNTYRATAPTVRAAQLSLSSKVTEAVMKQFDPGGTYHNQYKKILKDKGPDEAAKFKMGTILSDVAGIMNTIMPSNTLSSGLTGQAGLGTPQLKLPADVQNLLKQPQYQ